MIADNWNMNPFSKIFSASQNHKSSFAHCLPSVILFLFAFWLEFIIEILKMPITARSIRRSSRSRSPPHSSERDRSIRRVRWRSRSASGERGETRKRRTKSRSSSPSSSPPPPPRGGPRSPVRRRQSDSESRSPRNRITRDDPLPSKVLGVFGMRWARASGACSGICMTFGLFVTWQPDKVIQAIWNCDRHIACTFTPVHTVLTSFQLPHGWKGFGGGVWTIRKDLRCAASPDSRWGL